MSNNAFIITVDTEGDNLWARPLQITTENARYLPRFQATCERFGFKVTYLVTYEMAIDPVFQEFGQSVLRRATGEIGLHVHPWSSPPLAPGYEWDEYHAYLYELPDEIMRAKMGHLTAVLADGFGVQPISHRAGKWGFDERVARALVDLGYLADCSVTPGLSWRQSKGLPGGLGGPNYAGFPTQPYFVDLDDIGRPGASSLLEVPMTVRLIHSPVIQLLHRPIERRLAGRVLRGVFGSPYVWLRPTGGNLDAMLNLIASGENREIPVLQFMLHSSELMPGGSPTFRTAESIERLYRQLDIVFGALAAMGARGMTLAEYRSSYSPESSSTRAPACARDSFQRPPEPIGTTKIF